MTALYPFIVALIASLINILLCPIKIAKNSSLWLNIALWSVVLLCFLAFRSGDFSALPCFISSFIRLDIHSFGICVVLCVIMLIFLVSVLFEKSEVYSQEFVVLASLANFGLLGTAISAELILTLIFLEIASVGFYGLIVIDTKGAKSVESAFKYFLLSSIMGVFYLLGAAFIFASTGSTKYAQIASLISTNDALAVLGLVLVLSMVLFKIAVFGFYRWSIDVYYGANTSITGFLSSGFKLASFIILIRILFLYIAPSLEFIQGILAIIAVFSMFIGNILCLKENSVKKILIAASIVHSGYIFIVLSGAKSFEALYPALFYLCTYCVVIAFAFGALNSIFGAKDAKISDLSGIWRTHKMESLALVLASLSFIGFPLSVGFVGKSLVFASAFESGNAYLAVFGIINTIISVYYYLKIITSIYFGAELKAPTNPSSAFSKIFALLGILYILMEGTGIFSLLNILDILY